MIEKLKVVLKPEDWNLPVNELEMRCLKNLLLKIDELVDAVNELQMKLESEKCEAPTDKYAEQRKWIGKLCRFWDDSDKPENCVYDILCNIFDQTHHEDCPFQCGNGEWYEYCEPVKPDDDIIYKGEQ